LGVWDSEKIVTIFCQEIDFGDNKSEIGYRGEFFTRQMLGDDVSALGQHLAAIDGGVV